ncbi:MAG TPA: RagB/SusD family nutrient uptake outer membrane protein, partial [Gemmatimonadales bacterium]|nr:RagB/SusD family nutrient uptake outer membrane protein [Gemmatimonadales bacterium]
VYTGAARYADVIPALAPVLSGPYSLDPVYRHLFEADNNTSPEIIFPIVEDGMHTQSFGGTTFLIHAACGGSMANADYGVDGCWWGIRLRPETYNRVNGDPRHPYLYTNGQTVEISNVFNFPDGIAAPKFINKKRDGSPGSNAQFSDVDFPLFRLGDAYLMYAEAAVRTNSNLGQALTYVNQLRERAYGDDSGNIEADDLTLPFILNERGRELLWEAQRRTDLVRFGLFTGGSFIWSWKGNVKDGKSTPDYLNLYPIPATQLSANPNLTQNPGY